MAELTLLLLVARHPHPAALARRAGSATLFPALRRLECAGLVTRRRGLYRLTHLGRQQLGLAAAIARTVMAAA
jgi:DNA-binding PadR family transcriptional regulator